MLLRPATKQKKGSYRFCVQEISRESLFSIKTWFGCRHFGYPATKLFEKVTSLFVCLLVVRPLWGKQLL